MTGRDRGDMTKPQSPRLRDLAWQQQGIVHRTQAITAGLSPDAIRRRVRSGEWQSFGRGTYAMFSGKSTREAELWITVLRAGPGAVLSHETAAELHGFATPIRLIHVTVPPGRNPGRYHPIRGVVIHRSGTAVAEPHATWVLPRTSIEDTVLDLVAVAASFDKAYDWICRALGKRITLPVLLREALARRSRMRWRDWLTEALADAGDGVDSPLERRYARDVERAHGLPAAQRQARRRLGSGNSYLDNLYPDHGLCVELDGVATHPAEGRWTDTARDNANLAAHDTRTLRFGWVEVTEDRCRSAQQVADILRRGGWTGTPRPCGPGCPVR
jgi:hypothetical protein